MAADYTKLITSEHAGQPKFTAMVAAVSATFGGAFDMLESLPAAFDLDVALGAQLDAVGLWVGLSRYVNTPLNVYFSLDTTGLGFDQGSWKGPYDPTQGLVALDDATYRTMIRAKIGANHWDGTLPSFVSIWQQVFAGTGATLFAVDNQDMTMDVYLVGTTPPAVMLGLLKNGYMPIKPAGVHINGYTKASVDNTPLFGFDVQNQYVAGFDTGSWGVSI